VYINLLTKQQGRATSQGYPVVTTLKRFQSPIGATGSRNITVRIQKKPIVSVSISYWSNRVAQLVATLVFGAAAIGFNLLLEQQGRATAVSDDYSKIIKTSFNLLLEQQGRATWFGVRVLVFGEKVSISLRSNRVAQRGILCARR